MGTFGQSIENRAEDPLADMEMPDATFAREPLVIN